MTEEMDGDGKADMPTFTGLVEKGEGSGKGPEKQQSVEVGGKPSEHGIQDEKVFNSVQCCQEIKKDENGELAPGLVKCGSVATSIRK